MKEEMNYGLKFALQSPVVKITSFISGVMRTPHSSLRQFKAMLRCEIISFSTHFFWKKRVDIMCLQPLYLHQRRVAEWKVVIPTALSACENIDRVWSTRHSGSSTVIADATVDQLRWWHSQFDSPLTNEFSESFVPESLMTDDRVE